MKTPRTDAAKFRIGDSNHFAVHVMHVEQLETELQKMRNALKSAQAVLEDWQLFWKERAGHMAGMAWEDGRALQQPTESALAEIKPFTKP